MGAMASQITSLRIVYSTVYLGAEEKKTSKLRTTGLCVGNSLVTGEFPAQMASNAKSLSIDDVIMGSLTLWVMIQHVWLIAYLPYMGIYQQNEINPRLNLWQHFPGFNI